MQHIKAIFDLWNGYIKWTVIWLDDKKHSILVKDMVKTKWMRKWKLLDPNELTICIKELLAQFHKKLWWDFIDEAWIILAHPEMDIRRMVESKRVMSGKIDSSDCEHLSKVINDISHQPNLEILKIIPAYRIVDDNYRVSDPIWMDAKKLEIVADVFSVPKNFYNSLIDVFDKVELNIADVVPSILCASDLLLDFDLKDLGTMLVDIWFNQTSYVVFENWFPLVYGVLPYGWEDVSKDVSIWLKIDMREAESIKIEQWLYGNDTENDARLDLAFLSTIISARYEEIFEKINMHLAQEWKDWRLPWWVILMWWWAKLEWVDTIAKDIFKLATFYAKDRTWLVPEISSNLQLLNLSAWYNRSEKYQWEKWWWWFKFDWSWTKKVFKFIKDIF